MSGRDDLESQAHEIAAQLLEQLIETSEEVDYRGGTFLLAALCAELGQQAQRRCTEMARTVDGRWELAIAETESLINGAWRTMETVARLSDDFRGASGAARR